MLNAAATLLTLLLGAPHFGDRQRASFALRDMGLLAYPALLGAMDSTDAEIRRRAAELLQPFEPPLPPPEPMYPPGP